MRIREGDLWNLHKNGYTIAITTNGSIINNKAVMGTGIAKQAKQKYFELPEKLAKHLNLNGNIPALFFEENIVTLPTKNNWWENSDIRLILKSLRIITKMNIERIYIPKPGCGQGNLKWESIKDDVIRVVNNTNIFIVDIEGKI